MNAVVPRIVKRPRRFTRLCSECGVKHSRYRDKEGKSLASYCRACHAEYMRKNRVPHSQLTDEQKKKSNARAYANVTERRGRLVHEPCETCGDAFAEKHHDDYDKPLEVRWLCRPCHLAEHQAETEMRKSWPEETVRILENWAMWLINDKKPVSLISPYPAYRMAARGKRAGNIIPILGIDAEKADDIITRMVPRYQQPLRMHYLWTLRSDRSKALACNCALNTYKDRLNEAHALFESEWYQSRARTA